MRNDIAYISLTIFQVKFDELFVIYFTNNIGAYHMIIQLLKEFS